MQKALCSAPNASAPSPPPAKSKMKAIRDCAIPHVTFTMLDGSNEPYDVCIPNTNVAESVM